MKPRVSREGKAGRISLEEGCNNPLLIRFIEVSSWTVTYSTKLEAAIIETFFPECLSRLETFHSSFAGRSKF